jgi:hypothetical protein
MINKNLWFQGGSLSGKTDQLIKSFGSWVAQDRQLAANSQVAAGSVLAFSVNSTQRRVFSERFAEEYQSKYPIVTATPRSFLREQVILYFPLLIQILSLKAELPILLRIENEQELAEQLWAEAIASGDLAMTGVSNQRLVRRLLDLYLLAANSGQPLERIPTILNNGFGINCEAIATALNDWRIYCWKNGLLTYGGITELYGKYLLPHPIYQKNLLTQYKYLIVDDVDEYPAVSFDLCKFLLTNGVRTAISFNPNGAIRLGLGADPECWQELAGTCEIIVLNSYCALESVIPQVLALTEESWNYDNQLKKRNGFFSIQTLSRAKLLRKVAEEISIAIECKKILASEIVVIAPGLDRIAIYSLTEILKHKGIEVLPLQDQSSLSLSTEVRSLLTLLAIIYPNLGELVSRDRVAEMLVALTNQIDPVRAGLIADRCFVPSKSQPQLLDSQTYQEWHRLGYSSTEAYQQLRHWISEQTTDTHPLVMLNRSLHKFLIPQYKGYALLKTFEELIETAQHYWQIGARLNWREPEILFRFIRLILSGTVTANPSPPNSPPNAITLATIYQYRMLRSQHKWQFWLDAGSALWAQGGSATLFGAPLFLRGWEEQLWTQIQEENANQIRLQNLLQDLIRRTGERIYFCFSELAINGQLQEGVLLPLFDLGEQITE